MQEVNPWHEQDAFWETVAPVLFVQRRWSDALTEVGADEPSLGRRTLRTRQALHQHLIEMQIAEMRF